jgi:arylsulfatase
MARAPGYLATFECGWRQKRRDRDRNEELMMTDRSLHRAESSRALSRRTCALLAISVWLLLPACAQQDADDARPGTGDSRPNVLLIIADDLGYADVGAYGSEIETPNIDGLAREGIQLTNFHVAGTCSPSRSMLLTGVDNQLSGLGNMGEFLTSEQQGQPGYEGHLNDRVATVSELLRDAGYETFFSGKWHLGRESEQWPFARGFMRSYALLGGSGDNFSDTGPAPILPRTTFVEDDRSVDRGNAFSSTLYVDKLLEYIGKDRSGAPPFFGVLSFQAVHWPHHAPPDWIRRHDGIYEAGWDALRAARFARQKELGLVPADLPLPPRARDILAWEDLSEEQRALEARRMAAYAGMTAHMDHEIGRVLERLRRLGVADDTLVLFVSDNGPDPSEPDRAPRARSWYAQRYPVESLEGIGGPGSFPSYGPQWAQLGAVPLREFKGSASEGGLRVPLIVRYPGRIAAGQRSSAFGFATDVVPTILEAADVAHPGSHYRGRTIHPPTGRSLWPTLQDPAVSSHSPDEPVGYALMKNRALFRGDHKLVRNGPPSGDGRWELFDLRVDPSERHDRSSQQPALREEMLGLFERYAEERGVIAMPDDYDVFKALTSERVSHAGSESQ